MKNKAVVAVARELAGFVWAIAREVHARRRPATAAALSECHAISAKEVPQPTNSTSECRRGNAAQPRPLGNPRQRYWWATRSVRDLSP